MSAPVSTIREPLITGHKTYHQITEDLIGPTEKTPPTSWVIALICCVALLSVMAFSLVWTFWHGIGAWNLNRTIGWGYDITNFVWWIGIGHAGTLISAILLLFRQKWRTGVNRAAEAMTIFAVMCAGIFPATHTGRPWFDFFMFPYPNTRGPLWVNFNSPLLWDIFAISTYFTVSLLFWYTGLVPDFATVRDRATGLRRKVYNALSFGWTGSAKHWQRWESLSLILAGIATPLVLSVHTIVSFDFATSVIPGWHTTIFPPYFVAEAIFSGFAMVQTLMLITRKILNLQDYITLAHIESMNKVILLTGTLVGSAYLTELFIAWYSGYVYEQFAFLNRAAGPYWWSYFGMMFCNLVSPQIFWWKKMRRNLWVTFLMSIFINIGMWFERYVIIATTLARDYLPSSWSYYAPSWVEIGIFAGSMGLFGTLYLIFCRVAPVVAVAEIKHILKTGGDQYVGENAVHHHGPDGHGGHDHGHDAPKKVETGGRTSGSSGITPLSSSSTATSSTKTTITSKGTTGSKDTSSKLDLDTPTASGAAIIGATGAVSNTGSTSTGSTGSLEDDLKKVEGIGPKIEELLKAAGIKTFAKLSETDVASIKEILVAAGPRFASKVPGTWPKQAGLAAAGKWDELKKWQDELDGGK